MRRFDRTTQGPPCIVSNVLQTSLGYGRGKQEARGDLTLWVLVGHLA